MAQFFGLIPLNAENFESGEATEGQVLSADGSGGASWETVEGGSGTPLVDVTYAQLVTLIGASGLTAGQQYRITDFATTHYIVDGDYTQYTTGDGVIVGSTEPLIITAVDVDKLDTVAKSATYPQDIIYYDWNPDNWLNDLSFAVDGTTIITGWKGVIISRYDTIKEIQAPSDWRNCVTRRWETAAPAWDAETTYAAGDIISHDFVNDDEETVTVVYKSLVGTNVGNEPAGETDAYWIVLLNLSTFTYWNASPTSWNGVPSAVTYDDFQLFNNLSACSGISIDTAVPTYNEDEGEWTPSTLLLNSLIINMATNNNIGARFSYNTISNNFHSNTVGIACTSNTIGYNFGSNKIGNGFSSNAISNNFGSNKIGNDFGSNTIGNDFSSNTIGNDFGSNTIDYYFNTNTVGNYFYSNKIGGDFHSNTVGIACTSNTIGYNFGYNTVGDGFGSNTVGDNFYYNTIGYTFERINFLTATHVYGTYDCTLFKRLDGTPKLRYFDNNNVQRVVAVTA